MAAGGRRATRQDVRLSLIAHSPLTYYVSIQTSLFAVNVFIEDTYNDAIDIPNQVSYPSTHCYQYNHEV